MENKAVQCLYYDYTEPAAHAGILMPNGDVVAYRTGMIMQSKDNGMSWRLIDKFSGWTDTEDVICKANGF